jgi:queuine tRNA-ribosyltransferase
VSDFRLDAECGSARAGRLTTAHGVVATPAFMPVATQASVKGASPDEVAASGASLLIMNTYHLWLRPGAESIARQGGLHAFCRWPHAIATDSGGYQAFSLSERVKLTEDGFEFASHLDGRRLHLSPEEAMRIQGLLGSDLAMPLDVCPPAGASRAELVAAVERTTRWAERCLAARNPGQALFGIVQGGVDVELRREHARVLARFPFDGLALGGFSVGEPPALMHQTLAVIGPELDRARPRYLMGVGTPADLIRGVGAGIDLFDCVLPTRNARNGQAFTRRGKLVIKNARHRDDPRPLEADCECPACAGGFSRAYLRHLFVAREMLALRLLTLHNLHLYARLTAGARAAVLAGTFGAWAEARLLELEGDPVESGPEGRDPLRCSEGCSEG